MPETGLSAKVLVALQTLDVLPDVLKDRPQELEAAQERYRLPAQNASDVVVLATPDWVFEWVSGHSRGPLTALCRIGQRPATLRYLRSVGPTYSWRGRAILSSGSWIISCHCAIQPGNRPSANSTVNILGGKPRAR